MSARVERAAQRVIRSAQGGAGWSALTEFRDDQLVRDVLRLIGDYDPGLLAEIAADGLGRRPVGPAPRRVPA